MPQCPWLCLIALIAIILPVGSVLPGHRVTHDENAITLATTNEVQYIFSKDSGHAFINASVSPYIGSDKVAYSTGGPGTSSLREEGTTVNKIKNDINKRIIVGNQVVKDKADELATAYPGPFNIGQVCSIYGYIRNNWSYINDPTGEDYYKYPNETLQQKAIGGDCDDFAILMSSLIDAIGGTTRIMLAYGPNGGHAYTEVYLGKIGSKDQNVEKVIKWLKIDYNLKEVSTHKNLSSNDVWLNLDWSANNPGGPFDPAPKQVPILLRSWFPMTNPNSWPWAAFITTPDQPNEGVPITFNASLSNETDCISKFDWDFGDGTKDSGQVATHTYAKPDNYTVILKVIDINGAISTRSAVIKVDAFPEPVIGYEPIDPKAGDTITFYVSNGKFASYEWNFQNETIVRIAQTKQVYSESGNFSIWLTVANDRGVKRTKSIILKINEPPLVAISQKGPEIPNVGDTIEFDAAGSKDNDGRIVDCLWEFEDGGNTSGFSVNHTFNKAGSFDVKLIVKDDNNATSTSTSVIKINGKPVANFSFEPKNPIVGEDITFNANESKDDGNITSYDWYFGDLRPQSIVNGYRNKIIKRAYYDSGEFNVTLVVTDDKGAKNLTNKIIIVKTSSNKKTTQGKAWITCIGNISNPQNGAKVAQSVTIIGKYNPADLEDAIWVFVVPSTSGLYYPQYSCNGSRIFSKDGSWETRIGIGQKDDIGNIFDIVVSVADTKANQSIVKTMTTWCEKNQFPGLEKLPDGINETYRISVIRNAESFGPVPSILNVQTPRYGDNPIAAIAKNRFISGEQSTEAISGSISITDIAEGDKVPPSRLIHGNFSSGITNDIWVLIYSSNGKWYPQSIDPSKGIGSTKKAGDQWQGSVSFGGDPGNPSDIVVFFASPEASKFLNEFQMQCYKNNEYYPGLLTLQLPSGLTEKTQIRVYRESQVIHGYQRQVF